MVSLVLVDPAAYCLGIYLTAGGGFLAGLLAMWAWLTYRPSIDISRDDLL